MGMDPANVYIGDIGDVLEINQEYMKKLTSVPAGRILVDGLGVGDVGEHCAAGPQASGRGRPDCRGMYIDDNGQIVAGPDVVSRGFVYVREAEPLIDEAKSASPRRWRAVPSTISTIGARSRRASKMNFPGSCMSARAAAR